MTARPTIAVLIACHNRRVKTLACLEALFAQEARCDLRVILFDDGSRDGTAEAVRDAFPRVALVSGGGDAYWAGGMRACAAHPWARTADFHLWLNDDVRLAPFALATLLETDGALQAEGTGLRLLGGAVGDPVSGLTTYAGVVRPVPGWPLRFRHIGPAAREVRRCDTLLGNVVLVPRTTLDAIGDLDPVFQHTLADLDYGLRVSMAGGWVGLAPGHVGTCVRDAGAGRWLDDDLSLRDRWRLLRTPKGFPLRPWLHFARRHGGLFWFAFAALPYWRLFVPAGLARRIARRRVAGLAVRHA